MRRLVRFTIRDLAWLTVAVSVALGWWLDHQRLQRQHAREIDEVEQRAADLIHETTNDFGQYGR